MPRLNGSDSRVTPTQYAHLQRWQSGSYAADWTGVPAAESTVSPDGLDRAALEACVGAGLYPASRPEVCTTRTGRSCRSRTPQHSGSITYTSAPVASRKPWPCRGRPTSTPARTTGGTSRGPTTFAPHPAVRLCGGASDVGNANDGTSVKARWKSRGPDLRVPALAASALVWSA
jgi:hypothetical protein